MINMVEAIDNQVHGTITHAKAATCMDCGKTLDYKEPKDKEVTGTLLEAEHCGRKYSISANQFMVNVAKLPEPEEKEKKVEEKTVKTESGKEVTVKTGTK